MRIRRIEAPTMAEALRRVHQELGDDAVILHSKTLAAIGQGGRHRRPSVEVLAAVDELLDPAPAGRVEPPAGSAAVPATPSQRPGASERRQEIAARLARFQSTTPMTPIAAPGPADAPAPSQGSPQWGRVGDRARRIALVGPTGTGKTTTLAKAAARAQLERGKRVGLITLDTYRIGAIPQLASYADILGAPRAVAHSPAELERALAAAADRDLVFIDTIGRSPLGGGVDGLRPYLAAAAADDVFLVLAATTRLPDALRAAAAFSVLGPNRLCVTKLDETDDHGIVGPVSVRTGLPLTWLGTGQNVPDDLEEPSPQRVAELLAAGRAA